MLQLRVIKFFYTSQAINQLRTLYSLKTCFKSHLQFLKYKVTPALSLANRLVKCSNYRRSFKDLHYFYVLYLRSNFTHVKTHHQFKYQFKTKDNYYFLNNYKQYIALNDLNRVLLWRLLQINPIFKLHTSVLKHKKKYFYTSRLQFTPEKFRILITLTWLKFFIKSYKTTKNLDRVYNTLENFLITPPQKQLLTDIKYQVYRLQLLRSL